MKRYCVGFTLLSMVLPTLIYTMDREQNTESVSRPLSSRTAMPPVQLPSPVAVIFSPGLSVQERCEQTKECCDECCTKVIHWGCQALDYPVADQLVTKAYRIFKVLKFRTSGKKE